MERRRAKHCCETNKRCGAPNWARGLALLGLVVLLVCFSAQSTLADKAAEKPKIAIFPLGGDAEPGVREKVGRALRAKLDRQGTYEPIDGPRMKELADEAAVASARSGSPESVPNPG